MRASERGMGWLSSEMSGAARSTGRAGSEAGLQRQHGVARRAVIIEQPGAADPVVIGLVEDVVDRQGQVIAGREAPAGLKIGDDITVPSSIFSAPAML
ncbi:hypothetical protein GCM10011505_10460 [Tistrella bauzanensis]|uniref:Uncharacterized protein n=1 Tax=Tistrella bauzanensis TaxID=657419 RepID=A0ABQ1IAV1_9PROT|nr:hypothetical protein GCM10011505_10460 [Tistrella bauzanensis]